MTKPLRLSIVTSLVLACLTVSGSLSVSGQRIVKRKAESVYQQKADLTAAALVTDDFEYTAGTALMANGWTAHSGTGTNDLTVVAPSLTYSGYPGSGIGNAVAMAATGQDVNRLFAAPVTSGSVYAALMVSVSSSTTTGDYFFHYFINGSTFWGKVFVQKDAATDNFAFGVSRNANAGTGAVYTGYTYTLRRTYLVIVKYTFVEGANNDTVQLFVDPVLGGAEPSATLTATDLTATDLTSVPGVGIRQGGSTSGSTQIIDGIRVGTTWEDVASGGGPEFQNANADMNGDGMSDYVITRGGPTNPGLAPTGSSVLRPRTIEERRMLFRQRFSTDANAASLGPAAIPLEFWTLYNQPGPPQWQGTGWGDAETDFPIAADFDGDGADDVGIWRSGAPFEAAFYSINSSDQTVRISTFGQTGDDPGVVGDYDGDGKDDNAVFRCPEFTPDTCYFFYRSSLDYDSETVVYNPWGFGVQGDFYVYPGDFNGDGKYDFCLNAISDTNPDQTVFYLSINGLNNFEAIVWGHPLDSVVPGDYDADGKTDFCTVRFYDDGFDGKLAWFILERDGGGTGSSPIIWGIGSDFPAPGDYDGDGRQDVAIYRWNNTDASFWVLPSNGSPYFAANWGRPDDVPLAYWNVRP